MYIEVAASICTIEDMKHAVSLGAELITSNEPAFMISELKKSRTASQGVIYGKGICF